MVKRRAIFLFGRPKKGKGDYGFGFFLYGRFLRINAPTIAMAIIIAITPTTMYSSMSPMLTFDCVEVVGVGVGVEAVVVGAAETVATVPAVE